MITFGSSVSWMILSPIAVFTDFAGVVIISHYRPFYHGTDLTLISLMVSMAVNAILVLPLPAVLQLGNFRWNSDLCQFYVWAFITFRVVQLLNLVILSGNWTAILKFSVNKKNTSTTTFTKLALPTSWVISGIIGILPIIGLTEGKVFTGSTCTFLSYDIGIGFGIFFGIFSLLCFVVSFVCSCDSMVLLKTVRNIAMVKYGAGRFYLPKRRSTIPGEGTYTVHERYNQLSVAWDLCKIVAIFVSLCFGVNHLPYTVIQFLQITSTPDRQILEEVVLWLVLVEALILPHALWCFSKRYRHALVYTCKVHLCRNTQIEEDPSSCTLQSYTRKTKNANGRIPNVGDRIENVYSQPEVELSSPDKRNGMLISQTSRDGYNQAEPSHKHANGIIPSRSTEERQTIATVTIENHTSTTSDRALVSHGQGIPLKTLSINIPNVKTLQANGQDLKRTSSACSRKEWKDQMIRKHLPAIFVNEAFDTEENIQQLIRLKQASIQRRDDDDKSLHSVHYYVSSDYHPDYLNTDSLHRKKTPRQESDKSESEGICGQYDDGDIANILDNFSGTSLDSNPGHLIRQEHVLEIEVDDASENVGSENTDCVDNQDEKRDISGNQLELGTGYNAQAGPTNSDDHTDGSHTPVIEIEVHGNIPDDDSGRLPDIDTHYLMTESSTDDSHLSLDRSLAENAKTDDDDMLDKGVINSHNNTPNCTDENYVVKRDNSHGIYRTSIESSTIDTECVDSNESMTSESYPKDHQNSWWMNKDRRETWKNMEDLHSSDTDDTLQSSHDSIQLRTYLNPDSPRSSISLNSHTFDQDVDRGFEEALSVDHMASEFNITGGQYYGSIKEESDDTLSFESSDMLHEQESFKTQAVVSKSRSESRSSTSSENPFDLVPITTPVRRGNITFRNKEPIYANCGPNLSTNSSLKINDSNEDVIGMTSRESSPWPDCDIDVHTTDLQFESNFHDVSITDDTHAASTNSEQSVSESRTNGNYLPPLSDIQPVYF